MTKIKASVTRTVQFKKKAQKGDPGNNGTDGKGIPYIKAVGSSRNTAADKQYAYIEVFDGYNKTEHHEYNQGLHIYVLNLDDLKIRDRYVLRKTDGEQAVHSTVDRILNSADIHSSIVVVVSCRTIPFSTYLFKQLFEGFGVSSYMFDQQTMSGGNSFREIATPLAAILRLGTPPGMALIQQLNESESEVRAEISTSVISGSLQKAVPQRAGIDGKPGRVPVPYGEYNPGVSYTATDYVAPYVLYKGQYYILSKKGTWHAGQGNPKDNYATGDKTWQLLENYKNVFAEIIMANMGRLGSAIFYGDAMYSMHGKKGDELNPVTVTNGGIPYYISKNNPDAYRPNLYIDLRTGELIANSATISGTISGASLDGVSGSFKELKAKKDTDIANTSGFSFISDHYSHRDRDTIFDGDNIKTFGPLVGLSKTNKQDDLNGIIAFDRMYALSSFGAASFNTLYLRNETDKIDDCKYFIYQPIKKSFWGDTVENHISHFKKASFKMSYLKDSYIYHPTSKRTPDEVKLIPSVTKYVDSNRYLPLSKSVKCWVIHTGGYPAEDNSQTPLHGILGPVQNNLIDSFSPTGEDGKKQKFCPINSVVITHTVAMLQESGYIFDMPVGQFLHVFNANDNMGVYIGTSCGWYKLNGGESIILMRVIPDFIEPIHDGGPCRGIFIAASYDNGWSKLDKTNYIGSL